MAADDVFEKRASVTRDAMKASQIQTLLLTSPRDLGWLLGLRTAGCPPVHCAVLRADAVHVALITRTLEMGNMRHARPRHPYVRMYPYEEGEDAIAAVVRAVAHDPILTIDASHISAAVCDSLQCALERHGSRARRIEVSPVARARVCKDAHELTLMARAAEATTMAAVAVQQQLEVGLFETEVAHVAASAICEHGACAATYPIFVHAGPTGGGRGHCAADSERIIERNMLVMVEIGASVGSYHAARMHTVFAGSRATLPMTVIRAELAVSTALRCMRLCAKAGCGSAGVARAGHAHLSGLQAEGWQVPSRLGYSIGVSQGTVDWGEAEVVSISLGSSDTVPLSATLHLIPHATHPKYGAVGFSATVVVGQERSEDLAEAAGRLLKAQIHCIMT